MEFTVHLLCNINFRYKYKRHLTYGLFHSVFGVMAIVQFIVQTHVWVLLLPEEGHHCTNQTQCLPFHL